MRLLSLGLAPYGAYREDAPLRLDGAKRFHVLYGLNESGKTTRRAAIADLLFGFEHRTEYAFAYEMSILRICASVEADGVEHPLERRKGRSGTLRDASGAPIAEERMHAWLGGVDRETFLTRFSFGAQELRKGAELLLSSGGNVGHSLYSAALAGADARSVLADLEREAEALFKPRGQNMPINAALARYAQLSKCVRESQRHPDELRALEEEAKRIGERLQAIDVEQGAAQQRLERLDAIVSVIPDHERYRELRRVIDEARARERVPDEVLDTVRASVEVVRELQGRERVIRDARERIDADPLAVDERLLDVGAEIDALAAELAAIEKSLHAVRDGRIEERIRRNHERCRALRERYWPSLQEAALREREPSRKALAEAQKLASEHAALEASKHGAQRDLDKALREQQRLDETLGALCMLVDTAALEAAVEAARALGDVDELLARRESAARAQQEKLDVRAMALRFIQGGAKALAALELPLPEQIVEAVGCEQDARNRETLLHEQRARAADALAAAERVVREHEAAGALGVTERLEAARRERETYFGAIERAWRAGDPYDAQAVSRYGDAAAAADRIADERYARADAVARADRALEDRDAARAEAERIDADLREAAQERATFEHAWRSVWEPARIVPDTPAAMREWLTRASALLAEFHALLDKEAEISGLRIQRDACRAALLHELQAAGHADAGDAQRSVAALVARGAEILNRVRSEQVRREQMIAQRERALAALDGARRAQERAGAELERWRERWSAALSALHVDVETPPEAINAVLEDLRDLFEAYAAYQTERTWLEGVRAEHERYRQRASETISIAAPDLLPMLERALAEAVKAAHLRLKEARGNAARLAEREAQVRKAQAELDAITAELSQACEKRDVALESAGLCSEGIDARIAAALELRRLRAEGERVQRELRLGARCSVEEIDGEAERAGYDGLRAELLSVRDVLAGLQEERERLIAERQKVQSRREELDRSDAAAQAQGDLLAVGGEIDRHARRYAALMLAKALLEEEINRYALTHQAPILATASRYLARLTCERYRGVRVVGDGDAQVIEVICDEGEKTVEALSDGTRDQLYLALRLSVLEEHLRASQPLPLIVDDALLTFDDRRTAAALLAFRDFAKTTQVIYFTHHERVLDIARDTLGAEADLVRIGGV